MIGLVVLLFTVSILLGYKLTQGQSGQQLILAQGETTYAGLLGSALLHRLAFGAGLLTLTPGVDPGRFLFIGAGSEKRV